MGPYPITGPQISKSKTTMRSSPLPGVIENANSVENDSRLLRFPLTNLKGFLQRRRPELETDGRVRLT
ncbi:hypothetical protein ACFX2A_000428 [Malus domestica]